jgi:peptidoglycan/LPS O-acetylase OafA/YrhL
MTTERGIGKLTGSEKGHGVSVAASAPADLPRPGWEAGGLRRFSALDGLRAFAVMAVLFYHAGISWVGGGLLGVDVFFVLSGFLITSLLCRELSRSATVRVARFWARRARRLLPALIILLLGVAAYAYAFRSSVDVSLIRGDSLSTLFYVANWHFILADQGYFAQTAAPSPLLHTWSLAVEEQYYLIWPLVALFVVRRWGIRALAVTATVAAVASAVLMGMLYAVGTSVDRLYYGTDTRAQALLVGSVLGALGSHNGQSLSILPDRWTSTRRRRRIWTAVGAFGAAYLVWAWNALGGQDPVLYHGGFFVVALAAGAVIVGCVAVPNSLLARFLSIPVIVFIGRISYGLYLYHWPLFLAIDHQHTGLSGAWLLLTRLAVTFAVATVSFVFIEEPIRTRRMFRGRVAVGLAAAAAAVTAATLVAATVAPSTVAAVGRGHSLLSPVEHQALASSHAFSRSPIRFILTGDSVAVTLGAGLTDDSVRRYGVHVIEGGLLGCDLDDVDVRVSGTVQPATPGCTGWRSAFKVAVDASRPQVVGVLLGRWEVTDHLWHGRWVHVGERAWDRHLVTELEQVADIFSSKGAKVVFFTCPFVDPPVEAANGTPFPENDPSRMKAWNRLVVEAADKRKATVTVIRLNRLLDPHGRYQAVVDGYTVRSSDGIHISTAGGELAQRWILPVVAQLGLESRARISHP